MNKFKNNFNIFTLIFILLYVCFNQIMYRLPFIETLMNSFFWLGFTFMIIGLYGIVDILGLMKSFFYLFYKREAKQANKTRIKEGEEPLPILDLYGYMQVKKHLPKTFLIKVLIMSCIFYGVSFLISLRYI